MRLAFRIPDAWFARLEQIARERSITKVEALRQQLAVLEIVQVEDPRDTS